MRNLITAFTIKMGMVAKTVVARSIIWEMTVGCHQGKKTYSRDLWPQVSGKNS